MPSLSYNDYVKGIRRLSLEEQLNLIEFIFANLRKRLNHEAFSISEDSGCNNLSEFCGKWQDDQDADEIVSTIYADRRRNIRSEKAVL